MVQQSLSPNADDDGENAELNLDNESIDNIEVLLKVLKGRIEKNLAEKVPHRGGQPRKWRRMMSFDDLLDTDPVESSIWYENVTPQLPRMLLRERHDRGGELAILRDISSSMAGIYSKWASSVILRPGGDGPQEAHAGRLHRVQSPVHQVPGGRQVLHARLREDDAPRPAPALLRLHQLPRTPWRTRCTSSSAWDAATSTSSS